MRKTPRPAPLITLGKNKYRTTNDSLEGPSASYYTVSNRIVFSESSKYVTDDDCVAALLHELDHWTQDLFLTQEEYLKYMKTYDECYCHFTEWINPFKSYYDFSYWEEKYGRKKEYIWNGMEHAKDS